MKFIGNKLPPGFAGKGGDKTAIFIAALFLLSIVTTSWYGIGNLETRARKLAGEHLELAAKTIRESLRIWFDSEAAQLSSLVKKPRFVEHTKQLLACQRTPEALRKCEASEWSEGLPWETLSPVADLAIIATDMIDVGSSEKEMLGKRHPIVDQRPGLLRMAFEGKTVFIPSIRLSSGASGAFEQTTSSRPSSFIVAPVQDTEGRVIAAAAAKMKTFRLLQGICGLGRIGTSGKVYLIDRDGRIVSQNFVPESTMAQHAGGRVVSEAAAGRSGIDVDGYPGESGKQVLGAWIWDERLKLGTVVEMDETEALASHRESRSLILAILGLTVFLTFLLVGYVVKSGERIRNTLKEARDEWERIAEQKSAELKGHAAELEEANRQMDKSRRDALNLMQDAQEQKALAESFAKKLAESGERIKAIERRRTVIFEKSPAGMFLLDTDGKIIDCNDKLGEILGATRDKIIGFDMPGNVVQSEMRNAAVSALNGEHSQYEGPYTAVVSGKSFRWLKVVFNPITPGSSLSEVIATLEDISERKMFEEQLTRERRQFLQILEGSPTGVAITCGNTIRFANPCFSQMTGLAVGQSPVNQYVNPEDMKFMLREIARNRILRDFELKVYGADREIRDLLGTFSTMEYEGEEGVIAWLADIGDFKKIQNELLAAKDKAEDATRTKSEFLANMSHEIRTPMNAVIGMTYLALKTELTPRQRDYLEKIDNSAKSLLGVINDILDFSKIEAGRMRLESVHFDLSEILRSTIEMESIPAMQKGLQLSVKTSPQTPSVVTGDPLRLRQVLSNLITNAVKFTDSGKVEVGVRPVGEDGMETLLEFSVRDTGVGMTKKQMLSVFEFFSQAESSTTRKHGGTGLGLAICRLLVDMLGGEIWAESQVGEGSTFYFTARVGRTDQYPEAKRTIPSGIRGMKILVADDEAPMRKLMGRMLRSMGFEVELCETGAQAMEMVCNAADSDPFRLLILDWMMPEPNGMQVSRKVKSELELPIVPKVFVMTGFVRQEFEDELKWSGADGHFMKPVSRSPLLDLIVNAFPDRALRVGEEEMEFSERTEALAHVQGARILLAEDNEINRQFATELLKGAGVVVETACNGSEAVEMAKEKHYDAILMDIQMPEMDGYEATGIIRGFKNAEDPALKEKGDVPIFAMTAHAMPSDFEKSRAAGMDDHITKPLEPKKVFYVLSKNIKSRKTGLEHGVFQGRRLTAKNAAGDEGDCRLPDSVEGIDLASLSNKLGNQAAVEKLLAKFSLLQKDTVEKIAEASLGGDRNAAIRLCHNIKGVAGNLCAARLRQAAENLEQALVERKDDLRKRVEILDQRLKQVLSGIDSLGLDRGGTEAENRKDLPLPSGIPPMLGELKTLLEENDLDAVVKLEEIKKAATGSAVSRELDAVEKCIGRYDSDAALEALSRIMDNWEEKTT